MPTRPDETAVHDNQPAPRTGPHKAIRTVHELDAGGTTVTFEPGQESARSQARVPAINGKLPFDNNRPLLTTIISRHADSSKTLSPTSPPRSGHRMKKRLKITIVSGQDLTHQTTVTKVPPSTDVCLAPLGSPWLTLVVAEEGPR